MSYRSHESTKMVYYPVTGNRVCHSRILRLYIINMSWDDFSARINLERKMLMIKDLYYGNVARSEQVMSSEERQKLSCQMMDVSARLNKLLTPEQQKLHVQILDIESECSSIDCADTYVKGFCDGIELMLDYLNTNSKK